MIAQNAQRIRSTGACIHVKGGTDRQLLFFSMLEAFIGSLLE
jgi:hypothetical protein